MPIFAFIKNILWMFGMGILKNVPVAEKVLLKKKPEFPKK